MAEKYLRVIFGGMPEENNNSDIKEFDAELDTLTKNADRKLQAQASEYRIKDYR